MRAVVRAAPGVPVDLHAGPRNEESVARALAVEVVLREKNRGVLRIPGVDLRDEKNLRDLLGENLLHDDGKESVEVALRDLATRRAARPLHGLRRKDGMVVDEVEAFGGIERAPRGVEAEGVVERAVQALEEGIQVVLAVDEA